MTVKSPALAMSGAPKQVSFDFRLPAEQPDPWWYAGWGHTCALTGSTSTNPTRLYCWGLNDFGQLGIGYLGDGTCSSTDSCPCPATQGCRVASPQLVMENSAGISDLAVDVQSCVLRDSTVHCWGGNYDGQVGNGTYDTQSTPVAVEFW